MKSQLSVFLMIVIISFTSCSISMEKRRYRPGYHVEVVKNYSRSSSQPVETVTKDPGTPETGVATPVQESEIVEVKQEVSKVETPVRIPEAEVKKREKKKRDMDSCDVIFMADGKRIQARIFEITDEYVHYKLCDDPTGRLFSVKLKSIDNITLRNGELFVPPNRTIVDKELERKKSKTLFILSIISLSVAVIAFIFTFFITPFGTIGFILAIISGIFSFILALLDIRPGKYVPSYMTKLTWIFYLVVLLLVIASLTLLFIPV